MKILVLNSGSSSIKYKLYDVAANEYKSIASGGAERIAISGSFLKHSPVGKDTVKKEMPLPTHKDAIDEIMKLLVDPVCGVLKDISEIIGVGHRVLHGGSDFTESALVNEKVEKAIKDNIVLGPLHNPANLMGIDAIKEIMPSVPQVAVFDTAVHQSMPPKAYLYPLPMEQYTKHKIRRYGFHGTSHSFVSSKAAEILGTPLKDIKLISCHIGNGASLAAFQDGKVLDTSMGLTPLAGLMMGTRAGDIDPYIPLHIMKTQGLSVDEVNNLLNKQSGMLAIAGHSDMRDVENGYFEGKKEDVEAFDMYIYHIVKYIGAYCAAMNGVDVILFTAGVGENSPLLREKVLENFSYIGLELDKEANNTRGTTFISTKNSKVKAMVVPTDEELLIAKDTVRLINK
ncbi:MAG: acetate/propionate family kinase [Alphaproteobacteria bacterium]